YCMVAFGGAGPLHAARLARQVGIKKVVIPNGAGVGSAVGLLQANPKVDVSITRIAPVEPGYQDEVAAVLAGMREQLQIDLQRLRADGQEITWSIAAYMRYKGQGHEIRVELEDKEINDEYVAYMVEAFHQTYEKSYGYSEPGSPVEATEWYMAAEILTDNHVVGRGNFEFNDKERAHKTRKAYFPEFGEY